MFAKGCSLFILWVVVFIAGLGNTLYACSYGMDVSNVNPTRWQASREGVVSGSFDYTIWNREGGNSVMLIIVAVKDQLGRVFGNPISVFGPNVPGRCREGGAKGRARFSLRVPEAEGDYEVIAYGAAGYDLSDVSNKLRNNVDYPTARLGIVSVASPKRDMLSSAIYGRVWDPTNHPAVNAHVIVTDREISKLYGEAFSLGRPGPNDGSYQIARLPSDKELWVFSFHEKIPGAIAQRKVRLIANESKKINLTIDLRFSDPGFIGGESSSWAGFVGRMSTILNQAAGSAAARSLTEQLKFLAQTHPSKGLSDKGAANPLVGTMFELCAKDGGIKSHSPGTIIGNLVTDGLSGPFVQSPYGSGDKRKRATYLAFDQNQHKWLTANSGKAVKATGMIYTFMDDPATGECSGITIVDIRPGRGGIESAVSKETESVPKEAYYVHIFFGEKSGFERAFKLYDVDQILKKKYGIDITRCTLQAFDKKKVQWTSFRKDSRGKDRIIGPYSSERLAQEVLRKVETIASTEGWLHFYPCVVLLRSR